MTIADVAHFVSVHARLIVGAIVISVVVFVALCGIAASFFSGD